MSKRCAKCEYKLEDMCKFWQCWRKQAPLSYCSQNVINRAKKAGYIQYYAGGLGRGTKILDKYGLLLIIREEFNLPDLVYR